MVELERPATRRLTITWTAGNAPGLTRHTNIARAVRIVADLHQLETAVLTIRHSMSLEGQCARLQWRRLRDVDAILELPGGNVDHETHRRVFAAILRVWRELLVVARAEQECAIREQDSGRPPTCLQLDEMACRCRRVLDVFAEVIDVVRRRAGGGSSVEFPSCRQGSSCRDQFAAVENEALVPAVGKRELQFFRLLVPQRRDLESRQSSFQSMDP